MRVPLLLTSTLIGVSYMCNAQTPADDVAAQIRSQGYRCDQPVTAGVCALNRRFETTPSVDTEGRITNLHLWAVREGLRRAPTEMLFEDFCQRLVTAGVPLWRAFAGMRTLHPQGAGYTYTWWRDRNVVSPGRRERGEVYEQDLRDSPYAYLRDIATGRDLPLRLRRRLTGSEARLDFPLLAELANSRATD